jgi:hypothetical protein
MDALSAPAYLECMCVLPALVPSWDVLLMDTSRGLLVVVWLLGRVTTGLRAKIESASHSRLRRDLREKLSNRKLEKRKGRKESHRNRKI